MNMKKFVAYALIVLMAWSCTTEKQYEGFYTPEKIIWSEQGWSDEERDYWHHLNAG